MAKRERQTKTDGVSTAKTTDAQPAKPSKWATPVQRAARALALRGRATADVVLMNEAELAAFAALVADDGYPAAAVFGSEFDELYAALRKRVAAERAAEAAQAEAAHSTSSGQAQQQGDGGDAGAGSRESEDVGAADAAADPEAPAAGL